MKADEQGNQYCKECKKETWHTPKLGLVFENKRLCSVCSTSNAIEDIKEMIYGEPRANWRLLRERDGLTKQSKDIKWLEWNEDGTFKTNHPLPAPGLSLIMSPFNHFFTWQTTTITEILEQRDDYTKFKTGNSIYELFKL